MRRHITEKLDTFPRVLFVWRGARDWSLAPSKLASLSGRSSPKVKTRKSRKTLMDRRQGTTKTSRRRKEDGKGSSTWILRCIRTSLLMKYRMMENGWESLIFTRASFLHLRTQYAILFILPGRQTYHVDRMARSPSNASRSSLLFFGPISHHRLLLNLSSQAPWHSNSPRTALSWSSLPPFRLTSSFSTFPGRLPRFCADSIITANKTLLCETVL